MVEDVEQTKGMEGKGMTEQRKMTDMERNNKIVMLAHGIDVGVMTMFCILQVVGGMRSLAYALIVVVLGFVPIMAEQYFWRKNKESVMIKHLAAYGFAVFYTYTVFTAENNLVFLFVIPMILIISVYNDAAYSIKINIGTVVESILIVAIGAKTGKLGYAGQDSAVIQIVIMLLVGIYSYITIRVLDANNKQKVQNIMAAQEKTEQVLENMSKVSKKLESGIAGISEELEKLDKASNLTKDAMKEVSVGASDTAEAVQSQICQTEEIQNKVTKVNDAVMNITENMQHTLQVLENGKKNVEVLVEQVENSVKHGADVAGKLETLNTYMEEMNSIVELIQGITSQTSLLALNASIEAARAGEAGKGFSVVATEISGMATQTKTATVHITELIENVSAALSEVVEVIHQMIAGINEEKHSTEETQESFENIRSNTYAIRENVEKLTENVEELKDANRVIVDSIQTISAISEEVSAHANETMDAEEENIEILDKIAEGMKELTEVTNA